VFPSRIILTFKRIFVSCIDFAHHRVAMHSLFLLISSELALTFYFLGLKLGDQEAISRAFEEFDLDGSGLVDPEEFQQLVWRLGLPLPLRQVEEAMCGLDRNKDGGISVAEFSEV